MLSKPFTGSARRNRRARNPFIVGEREGRAFLRYRIFGRKTGFHPASSAGQAFS
jgi:hypothetical protein